MASTVEIQDDRDGFGHNLRVEMLHVEAFQPHRLEADAGICGRGGVKIALGLSNGVRI
jgi:hypothetical protein